MNCLATILFALFLLSPLFAHSQTNNTNITWSDIVDGTQNWINDNLDTNLLNALPEFDEDAVREFFAKIQGRFSGEYVIDLAGFKQTAQFVLPILQSRDELKPYARWLSVQIDYLEVADEIKVLSIPPPNADTNAPPPPALNPTPQLDREIWIKKLADRRRPLVANQYVRDLKRVLIAQQVPPELIWLAEVESSFDRTARSPVGAAGLFQLMPDTAKRFGLSLWPRDQRYQPEPSATASAEYLKYLHDRFKDWRLALAFYNDGEGSVDKLLPRSQTHNYDDISAHLPAETQMYVPRIEAVLQEREGANLEQLPAPPG